jgi:hypothetical protein
MPERAPPRCAAQTATRRFETRGRVLGQGGRGEHRRADRGAREVALPLMAAGVHVLVEKPMTRSLDEADQLLAAADAPGVVLAVGHTERFNPAVEAARPHLHEPRFIEVHRLGTFPERSLDIDVVFDLMIHDLDLVLDLVRSEVVAVEAVGVPVLTPPGGHRQRAAEVRQRLHRQPHGEPHQPRQVRKIRFFQQQTYLSIDYKAQEARSGVSCRRRGRCRRSRAGSSTSNETSPCAASSRTSSTRCASGGRRA